MIVWLMFLIVTLVGLFFYLLGQNEKVHNGKMAMLGGAAFYVFGLTLIVVSMVCIINACVPDTGSQELANFYTYLQDLKDVPEAAPLIEMYNAKVTELQSEASNIWYGWFYHQSVLKLQLIGG